MDSVHQDKAKYVPVDDDKRGKIRKTINRFSIGSINAERGATIIEAYTEAFFDTYVTLPSRKRRRASRQRQRNGLPPKRPSPRDVVDPLPCLDNVGACLPSYSLTWTSQDGDT